MTDWIQRPLLSSQHGAQRNAQQAMIALANRRREREDVERFLAQTVTPQQAGLKPRAKS